MKRPTFTLRQLCFFIAGAAIASLFVSNAIRQKHARKATHNEIRLRGGRIAAWTDDHGLSGILPSSWRPLICNVKLKNCSVDADVLAKIDDLGYHVVALDLTGTPISDEDLARLQSLPSFAHLRDLGLARTNVTETAVQAFESARPNCIVHGNRANFKLNEAVSRSGQ